MKANRIHAFGPPSVIVLEDVAMPAPKDGEVLVRVNAAGVGPWDGWIRSGRSVLPQPLPLTLGADLSGVIVDVGKGVTNFRRDDEIYGVPNARFTNACAEFAVASAEMIAKKPRRLSHVEAAAVPVVAVTAWQMLFDHAKLTAGQTVLILGGAGNVGGYAIQFAAHYGLKVVATGFARQLDALRQLGADQAVDVETEQFEHGIDPVDAVIDTIGGESQAQAMQMVKPGGILVSAVSQPNTEDAARRGIRAEFMLVNVNTTTLNQISALIDGVDLKPRIGLVLPMNELIQAHELLEGTRKPRPNGKIVIDVLSHGVLATEKSLDPAYPSRTSSVTA